METDCLTQRVVVKVKGEKADPLKILERLKRKSHRRVELISPILEPIDRPKTEDNKPQVLFHFYSLFLTIYFIFNYLICSIRFQLSS